METAKVKAIFEKELAAVGGFDSINAISSFLAEQPSEKAMDPKNPHKSSMNEVVDATDGDVDGAFKGLLSAGKGGTVGEAVADVVDSVADLSQKVWSD